MNIKLGELELSLYYEALYNNYTNEGEIRDKDLFELEKLILKKGYNNYDMKEFLLKNLADVYLYQYINILRAKDEMFEEFEDKYGNEIDRLFDKEVFRTYTMNSKEMKSFVRNWLKEYYNSKPIK